MLRSTPRSPDRLLPAEPAVRSLARAFYERVAAAPILSPHGHVPPESLAEDRPFTDPADLFVTRDHYVTRLLHASGVPLERLAADADPREAWRAFAAHWNVFAGTASGYWLAEELAEVFGIDEDLSERNADAVYDAIAADLTRPEFRPRALFRRFGIEVLATTDDPLDDLRHHAVLAESDLGGRVVPTFRPDRFVDATRPDFADAVLALLADAGAGDGYADYLRALEAARERFIRHGAVSADHGVEEPVAVDLGSDEAERLFHAALDGTADPAERRAFTAHMLFQMARMSVDDGLVMTVHAGVLRNHHEPTRRRFGPDTGHDIPVPTSFVRGLRPLLDRFGVAPGFHLVLFTVDETAFSRELAPLAGFYPSVYVGAPWWFLDAPDAMERFRSAVTETAGFFRTSGFIDDTRSFLSIPARHDTARRRDAAYLARLVVEGRMTRPAAEHVIDELVGGIPRRVFKL